MVRRDQRDSRFLAATSGTLILLLILFGIGGKTIAAQETEEAFDLGIIAVNCDIQAPGNIAVQEEGCRPAEGVVFTATIEGGEPIGSCTAAVADVADPITAGCSIPVPYGATVVVNEDPASVPAGYAPLVNGQVFKAPATEPTGEVGGVTFVNLLQADPTTPDGEETAAPEDEGAASDEDGAETTGDAVVVGDLPNTGVGETATPHGVGPHSSVLVAALAVMMIVGALVVRRGRRVF